METTSLTKELEDLKASINLAHHNHKITHEQVSGCIRRQKDTDTLVVKLQNELREMQSYTRALEDYCISLDTAVRKHHLILTGIKEFKNESLAIICFRVLQVCYPAIDVTDIDYCYRLGAMSSATKGRPVLVKLVKEGVRKEVLKARKYLSANPETSRVFINEDLPQIVNDRRANIKSVHSNAINKGHISKMLGTKIAVDNVTYNFSELENLPDGLKLSDSKLVSVKGGLAFASKYSYLSNFYECSFHINGQHFHCSEQAYQFIRAKKLGAPEIADKVMKAKDAKECKQLSYYCTSTPEWDREKRGQMKVIVQEKFFQNDALQTKLINTGMNSLIEATTDTFWGAGATFDSKWLNNGKWTGQNNLGLILAEVREDLKRTKGWKESQMQPSAANPDAQSSQSNNTQSTGAQTQSNTLIQSASKKEISFTPPNFSQRGRNANFRRGRGRGKNLPRQQQFAPPTAHAFSNPRLPAPPQQGYSQAFPPLMNSNQPVSNSVGAQNSYQNPEDLSLNQSQLTGMFGNHFQMQNLSHQAQLALMNNVNLMYNNQNQGQGQSIYAQFNPSGSNPTGMGLNQSMMANYQPSSQIYANGDMSIYPSHSVGDSSVCINSPLPLRRGAPIITTTPSQGMVRDSSQNGSNQVITQTPLSNSSLGDNDDCPSGSPSMSDHGNSFLGPVAPV